MAKKRSGVVRTTISIPVELKRRMDEVAESVNWSALAAEAFQNKLAEIAAQKKEKSMADVVDRLRASKRKCDTVDYQDGYNHGESWARQDAEASELQRLEQLHERLVAKAVYHWDSYFEDQRTSAHGTEESLFFELCPESENDRQAAKDFWSSVTGDALRDVANYGAFLKGFAEGALKVWISVKDEL
jgi:hypothetical protein